MVDIAWKASICLILSDLYFPVFELDTENLDTRKDDQKNLRIFT